ncbi:MAG: hypothetical protein KDC13_04635 [Bacteroidetes bacterium]|nr:hypothetical protein [Bacteroidota bacterium]
MAQNEIIELKNTLIPLPKQDFYIESVVDGRGNKSDIGFVMKGAFNKKIRADLKGGVTKSLTDFYNNALDKDTTTTPVVMRVVFFHISEKTNGATETGKAEIKVEFYIRKGNQLGKVFETESIAEESALDVTSGHERRIRKVLENVLVAFNNSGYQSVNPEFVDANTILATQSQIIGNTLTPDDIAWVNLLIANAAFGTNAEGWGASYIGYSTRQRKGLMIPLVVSIDRLTIDPALFVRAGYNEKYQLRFSYAKIGSGAIKKLGEDFNFFLGLSAIGTYEKLQRNNLDGTITESSGIVFGGEASQNFYFMSRGKLGFFLGAGVYERILNSDVYKSDIGLKIEAGIKF